MQLTTQQSMAKKKNVIYKIENRIDGKVYIGQTKQRLKDRLAKHRYKLKRGSKLHLYSAMRKHGIDNFEVTIIDEFESSDSEALDAAEIYWIDYYKSTDRAFGYNYESGGSHGIIKDVAFLMEIGRKAAETRKNRGYSPTPETISKIIETRIKNGKAKSKEQKALEKIEKKRKIDDLRLILREIKIVEKILNNNKILSKNKEKCKINRIRISPMLGKKHREDSKQKMRESLKIVMSSEEVRRKLSKSLLGKNRKEVDLELVKRLFIEGKTVIAICNELNICTPTLLRVISEKYSMTSNEYRVYVSKGIVVETERALSKRFHPSYKEVDMEYIKRELEKFRNLKDIVKELGITYQTASVKFIDSFGMTVAKYMENFRNDLSLIEIKKHTNIDEILTKCHVCEKTVNKICMKVFEMTYTQYRKVYHAVED